MMYSRVSSRPVAVRREDLRLGLPREALTSLTVMPMATWFSAMRVSTCFWRS